MSTTPRYGTVRLTSTYAVVDRKSGWPVFVDEIGEPVDLHTADGWRWLELPQQKAEELAAALGHIPGQEPSPAPADVRDGTPHERDDAMRSG